MSCGLWFMVQDGARFWSRPDVIASDAELLEGNRVLILHSQLHGLQVRVHRHVHTWFGRSGFRIQLRGSRV